MWLSWLLWLALPAQSPTAAQALQLGATLEARLALESKDGTNVARQRFWLELERPTAFTVVVRSLDFDPSLRLIERSGGLAGEGVGRLRNDALITVEGQPGRRYEIEVGSTEERAGTFTLSAHAGAERALKGPDLVRAQVDACEAIARRSKELGEGQRAVTFWLQAGLTGYQGGEPAAARRALENCIREGKALGLDDYDLEARLHLALCPQLEQDYSRCIDGLRKLQPEVAQRAERSAPKTAARVRALWMKAILHEGLADSLRQLQGMRAALPEFQHAAAIATQVDEEAPLVGYPRSMEVLALSKLAMALDALGQPGEADSVLVRCEAAARKDPGDSDKAANARLSRARIEAVRGACASAHIHALEALELKDKSPHTLPGLRCEILGTLAEAQIELARYEEASARLDELARLVEEFGIVALEIPLHRVRAVLFHYLGDFSRARSELELALQSSERLGAPDGIVESWIDLGLVLREQGQAGAAAKHFDQAVARAHELGNPRLECAATLDRGLLFGDSRETAAAAAAYREAARLAAAAGDEPLGAMAACGLGHVAYLEGDLPRAESQLRDVLARLEALGMAEAELEALDVLARIALDRSDAAALRSEIDRAYALLERGEPRKLSPFLRISHRARFSRWGALEQSLAGLNLARAKGSGADVQALLAQCFEQASRWKGRVLLESLPQGKPRETQARSPRDSRRASWLPADAVLLEYVESLDQLCVYVVQQARIDLVPLGDLERLAADAQAFGQKLADSSSAPRPMAEASHELWKRLLAPVLPLFPKGTRTLVVVPAPPLALLSFDALVSDLRPGTAGIKLEPRCLIDDFLVCYAPASALLPSLTLRPERASPRRFLILGDAVYAGAADGTPALAVAHSPDAGLTELPRLAESRAEVLSLARALLTAPDAGPAGETLTQLAVKEKEGDLQLSRSGFDLYVGNPASPEVLRRDLMRYSDLHLAVHTHIDPDDPRRSALVLSGTPTDTGLFTLEEIWNSHLDADLVVLSACDSARGVVRAGEGVQSLAYAFLNAGARAVAATLWPVNDAAARSILDSFGAQRRKDVRLHPSQALREARQQFRRGDTRGTGADRPTWHWDPWHWASWVYIGAPPR